VWLTEKPNRAGCSAISRPISVPLPTPEGPHTTTGRFAVVSTSTGLAVWVQQSVSGGVGADGGAKSAQWGGLCSVSGVEGPVAPALKASDALMASDASKICSSWA